jgi:hypothetical protein
MFAITFLSLLCGGHIQLGCNFGVRVEEGDDGGGDVEHGSSCGVDGGASCGDSGCGGGHHVVAKVMMAAKVVVVEEEEQGCDMAVVHFDIKIKLSPCFCALYIHTYIHTYIYIYIYIYILS